MSLAGKTIIKTNIQAFRSVSEANARSFSDRIDASRKLDAWKASGKTKSVWLSKKRRPLSDVMKEFRELYRPRTYFSMFRQGDDSFEVFFQDTE